MVGTPLRDRRQKTAMIIARRIVDDVRRGGYSVGDRLPAEKQMLEDYQVGRGTLREALRFLELQGVISLKPGPGGGPIIEKPDAQHLATALVLLLQLHDAPFSTLVEARMELEPIMARLAAQRLSTADEHRLTQSVDTMRANLKDRDVFLETNREFHDIIAWASGNQMYGFLIDALINIVDGTLLGVDYPENRRAAVLTSHDRILSALLAHDGDTSASTMAAHMAEGGKYFQRKYAEALKAPITWDLLA
jgi:GntR family transcriptional repressor for pyruvate dehydrogenase complex